jgi:hypothetical protein
MKINLDSIRAEIQEFLEARGIAVFHGSPRGGEDPPAVYWDTEHHPDYRKFLAAAEAAGARLVTLYANHFNEDVVDNALENLELSGFDRDERRAVEQRLREMRAYVGFICEIEISFSVAPRIYIFNLRTEWFEDLNDLLDRVDDAYADEEDDPEPLGGEGYFSKN